MAPNSFNLSAETITQPGDFVEASVCGVAGLPLHADQQFLTEVAGRVMHWWESFPQTKPLVLRGDFASPNRTKQFYRDLVDPNGSPTSVLMSITAEVLAVMVEELSGVLIVDQNGPQTSDPAWDAISIVRLSGDELGIRLVQAKASKACLQVNCARALVGFRRAENRLYDANLLYRLRLLKERNLLPAGVEPNDLLYGERIYRAFALHAQDRSAFRILTRFDKHISGKNVRRSVRLTWVVDWEAFWDAVARIVYAQLT